jgi:hypothetical protein
MYQKSGDFGYVIKYLMPNIERDEADFNKAALPVFKVGLCFNPVFGIANSLKTGITGSDAFDNEIKSSGFEYVWDRAIYPTVEVGASFTGFYFVGQGPSGFKEVVNETSTLMSTWDGVNSLK